MNKRFLYIFRHGPYGSAAGQEGLDAILIAAAMELETTVLFVEDGVFLLKLGQLSSHHQVKQYTKAFAALEDLGVDDVFVDELSMSARGIQQDDLMIPARPLDGLALSELMRKQDRVFVF